MAAGAPAGEDGVDLGQGELRERVVAVHVDGEGVDRDADLGGPVAEFLLEVVDLARLHLAAHGADLGGALDQRRRSGRGALALHLDADGGVAAPELLGPEGHEVVQRVRADGAQVARNAAGRLVGGERGVDGHGRRGVYRRSRRRGRGLHLGGRGIGWRFGLLPAAAGSGQGQEGRQGQGAEVTASDHRSPSSVRSATSSSSSSSNSNSSIRRACTMKRLGAEPT